MTQTYTCDGCDEPVTNTDEMFTLQLGRFERLEHFHRDYQCISRWADEEGQLGIGEVLAAAFRLAEHVQAFRNGVVAVPQSKLEDFLDVVAADDHPARKAAA